MSNNKQSSVEWLAVQLKEKMQMWNSTKNYQEFHIVLEAGEFAKLIEQGKAMHKEECIKYYVDSTDYGDMGQHIRESFIQIAEKMYNETFGGDDEQQ